ncbi:MAG TPA: SemiSWEET transporter [Caulobacterales bacterium]|nr:SemiSWEET transporter [Caulobacterales bacterium]
MAQSSALLVNAIGFGAAVCSMASFVPQILKLVHERDGAGVSIRMYLICVFGFSLWIAYGVLSQSWPVAGSNVVNLLLVLAILGLKLRLDR